jgi:hypothetical protein
VLWHVELVRVALREVGDERRDFLAPLAQRRHPDVDDVETVEQILAETPAPHLAHEIAVGGADGSDVHLEVVAAAHSRELTVLQHVEQLGLQRGMELADLVQEHRAAVGQLETARLALVSSREGPALVTEQLALEQLPRHGGAVHLDERGTPTRRVGVDRAGDQLLAHTGLAAHQHGDVGLGRLLDHLLDVSHRRTRQQRQLAVEPFVAVLGRRSRRRLTLRSDGHRPERVLEIVGRVGAANKVVGAGLDGLDDLRAVSGLGDHDDRSRRGEVRRPPHEVDTGHAGQPDRDERKDDAPLAEELERVFGRRGGQWRVAPLREPRARRPTLLGVALDEQHRTRVAAGGVRREPLEARRRHRGSFMPLHGHAPPGRKTHAASRKHGFVLTPPRVGGVRHRPFCGQPVPNLGKGCGGRHRRLLQAGMVGRRRCTSKAVDGEDSDDLPRAEPCDGAVVVRERRRLLDHIDRAKLFHALDLLGGGVAGDHDHGQGRLLALDLGHDVEPVHPRHGHV